MMLETLATKLTEFATRFVTTNRRRRKRLTGHLRNLRAEINEAIEHARTYEISAYKVPAYRCPTTAYDGTFTELLVEELDENEVVAIRGFYNAISQFNRCLDQAHNAVGSRTKQSEVARARVKARHVMERSHDVLAVVDARLRSV